MENLRKKMGLTQKKLGKRIGIKQSYVSKIENGHYDSLTIRRLKRIAKIFNIKPSELLEILEKSKGELPLLLFFIVLAKFFNDFIRRY